MLSQEDAGPFLISFSLKLPLQSADLSFQNTHLKLLASITGQEKIRMLTAVPACSQEKKKCEEGGGGR